MRYHFLFIALLCAQAISAISVVSVTPSPNRFDDSTQPNVQITFDADVDATTATAITISYFGRWSGPMDFVAETNGNQLTITATDEFFRGEWVTVSLNHDVADMNGNTLEGGYAFGFWISTYSGSLDLVDTEHIEVRLEGETFIQCYGAYAGDLDHDGWSDLAVVNEASGDLRIFYNQEGSYSDFTLVDLPLGNKPSSNEGTDFNGDGEIDLVIGNTQGDMMSIVMGDGTGSFGDETIHTAEQGVRGVAILDLEGDGDMDVATANRIGNNVTLFSNDGDGNFGEAVPLGIATSGETAISAADMNEDGWTDLIVGSYTGGDVVVLLNDGTGQFSVSEMKDSGSGIWMTTVGDINGDGHVDVATANAFSNNIGILFGDGMGGLSEADLYTTGSFPLAIDLGDLDGDGDLDVVSSNYSGLDFTLYENDGEGGYMNPRTYDAEAAGSCAIFHDRDNDGVMDMTGVDEINDILIIYQNSPVGLEELSAESIAVYPNPCTDRLNVYSHSEIELEGLRMIDLSGRMIEDIRLNNAYVSGIEVDLPSTLSSGTYFLISTKAEFSPIKIIKR